MSPGWNCGVTPPLWDAHLHLADARLAALVDGATGEGAERWWEGKVTLRGGVVNGTHPGDWERVRGICSGLRAAGYDAVPSYGWHPWYVPGQGRWDLLSQGRANPGPMPEEGIAMLRRALEREPYAAVGEIGLDRWVEGHCMELQIALFVEQWRLGCAYGRPITVHCLRAWGMLLDILQAEQRAPHGFLLHAYGGPVEMVPAFVALGASFSFSTAFIGPERAAKQAPFRAVPLERLLIETDAPDMAPPQSGLGPGAAGILGRDWPAEVNHPRTLVYSFRGIAALRELEEEPCAEQLARNYQALFG